MTEDELEKKLDTLGDELKKEIDGFNAAIRKGAEHAIRIGEILIEAKATAPKKRFREWIMERTKFSNASVTNFMALAKNKSLFTAHELSTLTKTGMLTLIRKKRATQEALDEDPVRDRVESHMKRMLEQEEAKPSAPAVGTASITVGRLKAALSRHRLGHIFYAVPMANIIDFLNEIGVVVADADTTRLPQAV